MKNLKIRGCALFLAATMGFTCCGCSLKGKITSSKNTIYEESVENSVEDSSTLSSYLEASTRKVKYESDEYIGENGYDKLNISFQDMDTQENIDGISAKIIDKEGNVLSSFSSSDGITTLENFKYEEVYTIIEDEVNNENYEKSSSYNFCLAKPNTKEEDTYNCVTIFKESKIYNKVREGQENKFDPSQFLYSEFEFDSMIIDSKTMTFIERLLPNIDMKEKLGNDKINIEIIDVEEGGLIEGGYYEIRNSSNKVVATFTGINEPQTIDGLEPGDYILKEVIAPDGCYNDKKMYQFTIDNEEEDAVYKYNVLYIYKEHQPSETLNNNNQILKRRI